MNFHRSYFCKPKSRIEDFHFSYNLVTKLVIPFEVVQFVCEFCFVQIYQNLLMFLPLNVIEGVLTELADILLLLTHTINLLSLNTF
jgi:hypothetical protein